VARVTPGSTAATLAAKAATATIPIAFIIGADPVKIGLVASLNRPGGNATGINDFGVEIGAKRLGQLHELVPGAKLIGVLVSSNLPEHDVELRDAEAAAKSIGLRVLSVKAGRPSDFHSAFATLVQAGVARCTSAAVRSSPRSDTDWWCCPRATQFPPAIRSASTRLRAAS
jgi:ABC-type uncharacterized transport system substrate-binding protein